MWINKLTKLYFGVSISGVLLALGMFGYVLFQNDGFVLGLSFIGVCIFIFVAFIDIQAVRLAQKGKTGLAIAVVLFWIYAIFSTLTSTDHQWQSRLMGYVFSAITIFKIAVLAINIKNKGKSENNEYIIVPAGKQK
jgi:Kef-type K+ transport system membrane component KefB